MGLEHALALLIFVGRAGDVWSTLYVTPKMVLEANPIARRFKRSTLVLGFAFCAVPFYDVGLGVMVAVPFLLVTASNIGRGWMSRVLGETEMEALLLRTAARSTLRLALGMLWTSTLFFMLATSVLLWLSGDDDLVRHFALGMAVYGLMIALHGSLFFVRIFRRAREETANAA